MTGNGWSPRGDRTGNGIWLLEITFIFAGAPLFLSFSLQYQLNFLSIHSQAWRLFSVLCLNKRMKSRRNIILIERCSLLFDKFEFNCYRVKGIGWCNLPSICIQIVNWILMLSLHTYEWIIHYIHLCHVLVAPPLLLPLVKRWDSEAMACRMCWFGDISLHLLIYNWNGNICKSTENVLMYSTHPWSQMAKLGRGWVG